MRQTINHSNDDQRDGEPKEQIQRFSGEVPLLQDDVQRPLEGKGFEQVHRRFDHHQHDGTRDGWPVREDESAQLGQGPPRVDRVGASVFHPVHQMIDSTVRGCDLGSGFKPASPRMRRATASHVCSRTTLARADWPNLYPLWFLSTCLLSVPRRAVLAFSMDDVSFVTGVFTSRL